MPVSLTFEQCGDGIGAAWTVLRDNAARAGLGAPVPTCPGWTVRDLVAHQGMVHRWAVAVLAGQRGHGGVEPAELVEHEGLMSPDILAWLDDGARDLLAALAFAPADLDAWFFLKDAPAPRLAWARRLCHETTMHAVDAMSAARGRPPRAEETWVRGGLATDGIDELLLGFLPRRNLDDAFPTPQTLVVQTTDTGAAWTLRLGEGRVASTVGAAPAGPTMQEVDATNTSVVVTGTAAQVYLGLWNRGDELEVSDPAFLETWRTAAAVQW